MMALLSLVLWLAILLVVGGVLYAGFLVVWSIGVWLLRPRWKWLWVLASLPVFGVLYVAGIGGLIWYATSPPVVFENALGFAPPAGTARLQSSLWVLGDSGTIYLAFEADQATVDRIVQGGLTPRDRGAGIGRSFGGRSFGGISSGGNSSGGSSSAVPGWWRPRSGQGVEVYAREGSGPAFATEEAWLVYDPATRETWYAWWGVD